MTLSQRSADLTQVYTNTKDAAKIYPLWQLTISERTVVSMMKSLHNVDVDNIVVCVDIQFFPFKRFLDWTEVIEDLVQFLELQTSY